MRPASSTQHICPSSLPPLAHPLTLRVLHHVIPEAMASFALPLDFHAAVPSLLSGPDSLLPPPPPMPVHPCTQIGMPSAGVSSCDSLTCFFNVDKTYLVVIDVSLMLLGRHNFK